MNLTSVDWLIVAVYFAFVLGIGFMLRRYVKTSSDFFLAGCSLPAWICGLAFLSANLGAQEVIGMAVPSRSCGMVVDIRVPLGLRFSVFGLILIVYGFLSDRAMYVRSLGINLNLYWGLLLLAFGAIMLLLGLGGHSLPQDTRSRTQNEEVPQSLE
jgi:hypothetical protein